MNQKHNQYTIGFYNLENLFDTDNHPYLLDDDFTPQGKKNWTQKRYNNKLRKLAKTISQIGNGSGLEYPVLVGLAEIENKQVVKDLLQTGKLKNLKYEVEHFDSPDERGIDTALIYHSSYFKVVHSEPIPLLIYEDNNKRDFTRDI